MISFLFAYVKVIAKPSGFFPSISLSDIEVRKLQQEQKNLLQLASNTPHALLFGPKAGTISYCSGQWGEKNVENIRDGSKGGWRIRTSSKGSCIISWEKLCFISTIKLQNSHSERYKQKCNN